MEDDSLLSELPEENMQEYLHARKQQCIQHARSKEAVHYPYVIVFCQDLSYWYVIPQVELKSDIVSCFRGLRKSYYLLQKFSSRVERGESYTP